MEKRACNYTIILLWNTGIQFVLQRFLKSSLLTIIKASITFSPMALSIFALKPMCTSTISKLITYITYVRGVTVG